MQVVAKVESLWRYPVKSMQGEQLDSAFAGFSGIHGDRIFAIHDTAAPASFPYLTARQRPEMLRFRPRVRNGEHASQPENQAITLGTHPGLPADLLLDVETPDGKWFDIEDPALLCLLQAALRDRHQLSVVHSRGSMTDCRPISLFSTQTAQQLSDDLSVLIDKRRFRANIYLDMHGAGGFAEDSFVGHTLRIGAKAVLSVLERDPRCKMITLDPDTAEPNPEVIKQLAHAHDGKAGVYAAVLTEGTIRPGDAVCLLP